MGQDGAPWPSWKDAIEDVKQRHHLVLGRRNEVRPLLPGWEAILDAAVEKLAPLRTQYRAADPILFPPL